MVNKTGEKASSGASVFPCFMGSDPCRPPIKQEKQEIKRRPVRLFYTACNALRFNGLEKKKIKKMCSFSLPSKRGRSLARARGSLFFRFISRRGRRINAAV